MSHWFLCARDLIWVVVSIAPLLLSALSVAAFRDREEKMAFWMVVGAIAIQEIGIALLYTGVIR